MYLHSWAMWLYSSLKNPYYLKWMVVYVNMRSKRIILFKLFLFDFSWLTKESVNVYPSSFLPGENLIPQNLALGTSYFPVSMINVSVLQECWVENAVSDIISTYSYQVCTN